MRTPSPLVNAMSLRLLASCAALFVAVGCSSSAPSSPSGLGGNGDPAGAPGRGTAGAVIDGMVSGSASVSSFRMSDPASGAAPSATPQMAGLRVRVVGTDLSAPVEAGTFRLTDVPGGTVRLQFQNDSVNATTELSNVSGEQVITVQVQISSTSAVIVDEVREGKVMLCHSEAGSRYHFITISQSAESAHRAHGDGEVGEPVPGRANMTFGEDCNVIGPAVQIEKSTNGEDADSAPGPEVEIGDPVAWEYVVKNTGTINLTGIVVTDDRSVTVDCNGVTTLVPGASVTCTGLGVATLGQYRNVGTVTATWTSTAGSGSVTDSDASHYLGIDPDDEEGDGQKVTLCHKTGAGFYVKVDVSVNAEPAHRAHGDAEVGEAVPGNLGKVFTASCGVQ